MPASNSPGTSSGNGYRRRTKRPNIADTFNDADDDQNAQDNDPPVNTSIWLRKSMRVALKQCAMEQDITMTELIRQGADMVLDKYGFKR